jgi:hypothetical protein
LYWLKAVCPPDTAASVNAGAGPPASAANADAATTTAAIAKRRISLAVEFCIVLS